MLVTLRGYQQLDFSSSSGEHIQGVNLFVSFSDDKIEGEKVERIFVRAGVPMPEQAQLGGTLNVLFDYKGRPEAVEAVD